jgi:hypothetical protein
MYTIGHQSYAPVLRLKQGEYLALADLRPDVAAHVIPHLIPPPPKEWDPEKGRRLLPDEMVYETARRVAQYWAFRPCLLDPRFLFEPLGEAEAPAWLERLFKVATSASGRPIPVFELADYEGARLPGILTVVDGVGVGVAIRLSLTDLVDVKLRERLHRVLLKQLRLKPDSCALILDMSQADLSLPDVHEMIITFFEQVTEVGLWHNVIFQGTNYPEKNPAIAGGTASVGRREWEAWKAAGEKDAFVKRGLMYGDFASDSAKFNFSQKGGRTIPHYRYATAARWVVDRGKKDERLRDVMPRLARGIVESGHFAGRGFSHADRMISDTALGLSGPGNATTWRRINIGHHITRVVTDLGPIRGFEIIRMSDALPAVQSSLFD